MYVMLPLTKGHLSNKDEIVYQKGCSYYISCIYFVYLCVFVKVQDVTCVMYSENLYIKTTLGTKIMLYTGGF